ncbi:hypothetical protein HPB48_023403 [Haemaphysalis longicornis]|uniref:Monocarboxylate transporter n=1 Tax=Haemaphysalis longicornis TaxID=44386 RepID=A0A9J6H6W4_HAELO|nr:hypothetical protein HPB48_023403 [Haemaphysalis longicornis]
MYTMDYFEKFRGTVSGLKSVGWTSSGLVLPIILSALTDIYNIYDTLVLLGAFTMNITPIVFLLKRPEQTMSLPCFDTAKTNLVKRQTCKTPLVEQKHKLPTANVNIHECEGAEIKVGSPDSRVNSAAGRSKLSNFLKDRFSFCKDFRMADATGCATESQNPDKNDDDHKSSVSTSESSYPKWSRNSEAQNKYPSSGNTAPLNSLSAGLKRMKRDLHSQQNSGCRTGQSQAQYSGSSPGNDGETKNNIPAPSLTGTKSLWLSLRVCFASPALYVILSAYVLYDFTYTVIITTIVAYALDKGLPMLAAESLIMYGAAATITGCLISPLVWDALAFSGYSLVVWNLLVKTTCLACYGGSSAYGTRHRVGRRNKLGVGHDSSHKTRPRGRLLGRRDVDGHMGTPGCFPCALCIWLPRQS